MRLKTSKVKKIAHSLIYVLCFLCFYLVVSLYFCAFCSFCAFVRVKSFCKKTKKNKTKRKKRKGTFTLLLIDEKKTKTTVMKILSSYFGNHSLAFLNSFLNILNKYNVLILNKYNIE